MIEKTLETLQNEVETCTVEQLVGAIPTLKEVYYFFVGLNNPEDYKELMFEYVSVWQVFAKRLKGDIDLEIELEEIAMDPFEIAMIGD